MATHWLCKTARWIPAAGGAVSFGSLTAATLGGLQGSNALALQDSSAAAVAFTVGNNNSSTTFSGSLTGGGSLTKNGSGKLTLSNTNTYTGATTVNAGTLAVDGALTASPVTVNTGGALEGGSATSGGSLTGTIFLPTGTAYDVELAGASAGQYDQLNVTGTAILSGATLNVSYLNNFSPAVNQSFTIIHTTGGVSGQFAEGSTVTVGNATYTVTYGANGGKDVVLTATSYNITPVTTTVSTSQASVVYGTPVSFTATVSAQSGSAAPAGSVDFVDTTAGIALGNGTFGSTSGLASTWTYTTGVKTFNVTAGDIITATYTPGMGFTGSSGTTTQTITALPITVTAAANTKPYDGTTSAAAAPTITSGSLVAGDTAAFTETYDTKNEGTGKTLTAAGSVDDGNGGANYAVTFVPNTAGEIMGQA